MSQEKLSAGAPAGARHAQRSRNSGVRHADPVTNGPFARVFRGRVKAALGIYLDCKRTRPDLAERLQKQADMALRQACQDEDLK